MRWSLTSAIAAIAATVSFAIAAAASQYPIVSVTGGRVQGESLPDGGALFRALPFAAPPIGTLRWRPPAPVKAWQGVRDAARAAAPCLQAPLGWNNAHAAVSDEDCLYLEVRTPHLSRDARLPVMVWIHGGANQAGSAQGYAQSNITRQGVVLVILQYRLGVFGFLSHPELTAESPQHASGNYALLDQVAALRWVQANIAQFGGDPSNVTLFGQSAGAQDVGLLLLSPLSKGLFSKAIEQSGTAGFGLPPRTLRQNEQLGEQFASKAGAAGLAALRKMPGAALLPVAGKLVPAGIEDAGFIWLQAVVDGWVVPRTPADMLAAGEQHAVPLMIGSNARELKLFKGPANARHAIRDAYADRADAALALYGLDGTNAATDELAMQIANDIMFRCPSITVARLHEAAGNPVWHYEFDRTQPGARAGVRHSAELPFVFSGLPVNSPGSATVTLQDYWTQFAKTGDPNRPGLPQWPRYGNKRSYLDFSSTGPHARADLRAPFCDLLPRP